MAAAGVDHGTRNPTARSNGATRDRVSEIQRARILAAMVKECSERGASNVSVAHVVSRAGVSRRTFYEIFLDREDCFLAAFDDALARVSGQVSDAYDPDAKWVERVRAGLIAILQFLDADGGAGQLMIVGSLGAGADALERRRRCVAQVIAVVDEGRKESKTAGEFPPLTAEGIVGGVLSVLHSRLVEPSASSDDGARGAGPDERSPAPGGRTGCEEVPNQGLLPLTGALMSMIVLPYLGSAAARRELARPVPPTARSSTAVASDPLRDLGMRLTYRTVRVLTAVAATPGGSNRQVALAAGIDDQGQISKLLARLQGLGLIENTGAGSVRGAPNSWVLTDMGWRVQGALADEGGRRG